MKEITLAFYTLKDMPGFEVIRDCVIELLRQNESGFMEPELLRSKVEESTGSLIHSSYFHSVMFGMESEGELEYWRADIRTKQKSETKYFYRLVKGA